MNTTERHTAIYIRVSTDNGTQTTDPQLEEILRFCKFRGFGNTVIYEDHASGSRQSRPSLDRLVKSMRQGLVERVCVYSICRLGRSLHHLTGLFQEFRSLRVPFHAISQNIDTSDSNISGQLIISILCCFADWERMNLLERCRAGVKSARARNVKFGRPSILHKRVDDVMALKNKGMKLREISRELKMPVSSVYKITKMFVNT